MNNVDKYNEMLNAFGMPSVKEMAKTLFRSEAKPSRCPAPNEYNPDIEPKPRPKRKVMRELEKEKKKMEHRK